MIDIKARQLIDGDFGFNPDDNLWSVTVDFVDDTTGEIVHTAGNPLVSAATEADALAYGEIIKADALQNNEHKLAAFVPAPVEEPPAEGV